MLSNSDSSARPIQQARTKGTRRRGDLRHVGGHDVRPLLSGRIRWRGGGSGMRKGTISGVGWNASAEMLVAEWRLYLYDPIGDLRDATDTNSENALHMTTLLNFSLHRTKEVKGRTSVVYIRHILPATLLRLNISLSDIKQHDGRIYGPKSWGKLNAERQPLKETEQSPRSVSGGAFMFEYQDAEYQDAFL